MQEKERSQSLQRLANLNSQRSIATFRNHSTINLNPTEKIEKNQFGNLQKFLKVDSVLIGDEESYGSESVSQGGQHQQSLPKISQLSVENSDRAEMN